MKVTTDIETITPAIAKQYLARNTHNRKLRDTRVQHFKQEILAGRWLMTHQGIAFDDQGVLLDGQHRLHAIMAAGQSVKMLVTRGLAKCADRERELYTMDVIDAGIIRTTPDQLGLMHGMKNTNLVVAACRVIALTVYQNVRMSVGSTQGILAIYGDAIEDIIAAIGSSLARRAALVGVGAMAYQVDKDATLEFVRAVATGESIRRGDAAYALRDWLLTSPTAKLHVNGDRMSRVAGAFVAALRREPLKLIKSNQAALDWLVARQRSNREKVRAAIMGAAA